jgi:hypothetical protein
MRSPIIPLRACVSKERCPTDKDLIRLSLRLIHLPQKGGNPAGFPVSPLAKLILTNQRFGKITGEGFFNLANIE